MRPIADHGSIAAAMNSVYSILPVRNMSLQVSSRLAAIVSTSVNMSTASIKMRCYKACWTVAIYYYILFKVGPKMSQVGRSVHESGGSKWFEKQYSRNVSTAGSTQPWPSLLVSMLAKISERFGKCASLS